MNNLKVLFFDIETTPNIVTVFQLDNKQPIHYQNILEERTIISIAWKWLGEKTVFSLNVNCARPSDDKDLLLQFANILKAADVIVAHYGDGFDVKYINTRLAFHKLPPMPNVTQIDTWKIARSKFYFNSNKLDYLAKFLGVGGKIRTNYELWKSCMAGDPVAIAKMVKYNCHDVVILEKIYLRLAAFVKPKLKASTSKDTCGSCGSHTMIKAAGPRRNLKGWMQRFQCRKCGHWESKKIKED